jgi:peptidyl-prolyl cis-trans isomerase A (cyclophilin A)
MRPSPAVAGILLLGCAPPLRPGEAASFPPEIPDLAEANEALGDPHRGRFPFADAVAGLPPIGRLRAALRTDEGDIACTLAPESAPIAVANFVGLARGLRPFRGQDDTWRTQPYYVDVEFHRAIAGQFVQTGRRGKLADGGYLLQDEISVGDSFARPGVLAMAGTGEEHTSSAQFFITTGPAKQLEGQHTIFGQCDGEATLRRIEKRVLTGPPPKPRLRSIEITRYEERTP